MSSIINIGISKYRNTGNTCYLNSILSILQQTPLFADYLITNKIAKFLKLNNLNEKDKFKILNKVYYQLAQLFIASVSNDDCVITPTSFKSVVGKVNNIFQGNQQQDSQEFFSFLISQIEEEIGKKVLYLPGRNYKYEEKEYSVNWNLLRIKALKQWELFTKNEYSPIKMMFTGLEHHKQVCEFCNHESNRFQIFTSLQVEIPETDKDCTLYKCFDYLIKPQKLDNKNKMKCDLCYRKNKASKNLSIWRPPKILVIHIKRFKKDMYGNVSQKLNNKIIFPILNLNIKKYISESSPYKHLSKYNLFGINNHHGYNINFGHYTSIVKNRFDNKWYLFNDSSNLRQINDLKELQNNNAYLLFYYRVN